jgi:hypothetical protein
MFAKYVLVLPNYIDFLMLNIQVTNICKPIFVTFGRIGTRAGRPDEFSKKIAQNLAQPIIWRN